MAVEELIELTVDLTQLGERAVEVVREPRFLEALRFLPGPFISEADLAVIAETRLLHAGAELPGCRRAGSSTPCSPGSTGAASRGWPGGGCRAPRSGTPRPWPPPR